MNISINNLDISQIEKHLLPRARPNNELMFIKKDYDISICLSTQGTSKAEGINITFGNPFFARKGGYIELFVFNTVLAFRYSTLPTPNSFPISLNDNHSYSYVAKIAGEVQCKALKRFQGEHKMYTYSYDEGKLPVFYIEINPSNEYIESIL